MKSFCRLPVSPPWWEAWDVNGQFPGQSWTKDSFRQYGLLGQRAADSDLVVSCCALSCSCLVTGAYIIPLFVLFNLPKHNSEEHWRNHMLCSLEVTDFLWLNFQRCSFLLVLHPAKLYLTSFIVHTWITGLFHVTVPMLSEAENYCGNWLFITGSNSSGHQILYSQYVSDLLLIVLRKTSTYKEKNSNPDE